MWRASAGHGLGDMTKPNLDDDVDDWETDADFEVTSKSADNFQD